MQITTYGVYRIYGDSGIFCMEPLQLQFPCHCQDSCMVYMMVDGTLHKGCIIINCMHIRSTLSLHIESTNSMVIVTSLVWNPYS